MKIEFIKHFFAYLSSGCHDLIFFEFYIMCSTFDKYTEDQDSKQRYQVLSIICLATWVRDHNHVDMVYKKNKLLKV